MSVPIHRLPDPAEALARIRPLIEAMPDGRIERRITLDLPLAVETIAGNYDELETLRAAIVAEFGDDGARYLDLLPVVAAAALRTETELSLALPTSDLSPLSRKLVAKHAELLPFAQLLVRRGLVPAARLDACLGLLGYRAQYGSLLGLEALIRDAFASAGPQSLVTMADLDEAKSLCGEMLTALGVREQSSLAGEANELRIRAINLLVQTYEEVRRRVAYVRAPEGDADRFAPSLWTAQRNIRMGGGSTTTVVESEPAPVATPVLAAPVLAAPAPAAPVAEPAAPPVVAPEPAPVLSTAERIRAQGPFES